jgi:polyisoprenoid-binding protein YceI
MAWQFETSVSQVQWSVRYLGLTVVKGFFKKVDAQVNMEGDDPTGWSVDVTIDTNSLESADADRDHHVRGPDYFDVEQYPTITFKSTRVERDGDGYRAYGDLTIRDVTREIALRGRIVGEATDFRGKLYRGFSAETTIQRDDFGISAGSSPSRDVHINLEALVSKQD